MPAETSLSQRVVVDSNLIVRLLTIRPDSPYALLWREWEASGTAVFAPTLLTYEVTNALWQLEKSGELSSSAILNSINRMNELQIELVTNGEIHLKALEFVRRFPEGKAYDSHFVALAELLGCQFWTSDKKLFNRVGRQLDWVRFVDDEFGYSATP